ncbi:MAG: acyl-CoA/acyl-ACP dehydrogenase [Gammaproteobacteria bacterium]|nr:acyl-CoA/acyl-ACP dehydrogenase [Gammaproteobacteria bacterium]
MSVIDPEIELAIGAHLHNEISALLKDMLHFVKQSLGPAPEKRLDDVQCVSYELAYVNAELYAMGSMLDYANNALATFGAAGQIPETGLALTFVADTVIKLRGRFERIRHEVGLSAPVLLSVFEAPELLGFCRRHGAPARLEEVGRAIVESGECGRSLLDDEKAIVASSFARFTEGVVAPLAEKIHREDLLIPDEILDGLVDLGCFALAIPEAYGGTAPASGHDNLTMVVVTEELSRGSLAAAGSPLTRPEILCRALMAGGYEPQKERWLPGIAQGRPICGIAVTEPDTGSDVAAVKLKATPTEGGWLLNGAKTWCTFGGRAELLLVLARTNPDPKAAHRGLSLFLLEKPAFDGHAFEFGQDGGGVLSGKAIPTLGYRGMHSFTLFFDDVFVPAENLVGGPEAEGKGFYLTMAGFAGGRIQTAARACGVMRAAYGAALRYATERSVFGKPLSEYQLTLAKLALLGATVRACQEMTYNVARLMDQGRGQMEASLVKLYACRATETLTREALQIHGGMGYSEETAVSRYFVDARVLSIFEGAEETLALKVVARDLILNASTPET